MTGTTDAVAALTADDGTTAVPQADAGHPGNGRLKCLGPEVKERKGPDYWVIGCEYEIPNAGNATVGTTDPLLEKPFVEWRPLTTSEPVDTDLDGRPIANAAGDLFQGATRSVRGFSFTVTRNEPFFDILKSETWSNTVNSVDMMISGVLFPANTLLLASIAPTGRYQFGAKYVNIGYDFERLPLINKHPFQHRYLNVGDQGWYTSGSGPSKGKFVNEGGDVISSVKLALDGTPLSPSGEAIYVGGGGTRSAAIATPTATTQFSTEALPSNGGWALYFKRVRVADLRVILF